MSFELITLLHLAGVFFVLLSSGACAAYFIHVSKRDKSYHQFMAVHGIGMLGTLVTGLGLLKVLGIDFPWPYYIWVKFACWLGVGAGLALASRFNKPKLCFLATLFFALLAASAAIYGPHLKVLLNL